MSRHMAGMRSEVRKELEENGRLFKKLEVDCVVVDGDRKRVIVERR